MRKRFPAAASVVLIAALFPSCSGTPTSANNLVVTYSLQGTTQVKFDSLVFENALGALVHVDSPFIGWETGFAAEPGHYVQASAWGRTLADTQTATLLLTLTAHGNSNTADSSSATKAAPGTFVLTIPRLLLP